jgi:hypothetical protein
MLLITSERPVNFSQTSCKHGLRALTWCVAAVAVGACGSGGGHAEAATRRANRFDAGAAWALIKRQVAVGQRPAGSPQLRRLAVQLRRAMPHARFEPLPGEPGLRNIVSVIPGRSPAVVIGAHYDTLRSPPGFVGANNGAAGSAIVVELARELARAKRPPGAPEVRFVLFDGEEPAAGLPEDSPDFYHHGLRGSRAYVAAHRHGIGAMVLLDYVAGKGLHLPREDTSTISLWARLRAAARSAGVISYFPDRVGEAILDDHSPFLRAGIPAVDLIDWSYPGHSLQDSMKLLDIRSVDAVGEAVSALLARWPRV